MSETTPSLHTAESRLKSSFGVRKIGTTTTAFAFGESRLKGRMAAERAVGNNLAYLVSLEPLVKQAGSYRNLLSGESMISNELPGQGGIATNQVLSTKGLKAKGVITFGGALVGPDYAKLASEKPEGRFKFYSSFDLTSPKQVEIGTQWFSDVVDRAAAQQLSLTAKSYDHAYDSLNIYTWHPREMAEIIKELYPRYQELGLYSETPHFFQGELEGVDPGHVGFAQEPPRGWNGHSHSGRMGVLGRGIDEAGGSLTPEVFAIAAANAGVNPAQPYLIAA